MSRPRAIKYNAVVVMEFLTLVLKRSLLTPSHLAHAVSACYHPKNQSKFWQRRLDIIGLTVDDMLDAGSNHRHIGKVSHLDVLLKRAAKLAKLGRTCYLVWHTSHAYLTTDNPEQMTYREMREGECYLFWCDDAIAPPEAVRTVGRDQFLARVRLTSLFRTPEKATCTHQQLWDGDGEQFTIS